MQTRPHSTNYKPQKYNPALVYQRQPANNPSNDINFLLKQGFDQQSNLLKELIVILDSIALTQNKHLQNIGKYTKQSALNTKSYQKFMESDEQFSPVVQKQQRQHRSKGKVEEEVRKETPRPRKELRLKKTESPLVITKIESNKQLHKHQKVQNNYVTEEVQTKPKNSNQQQAVGRKPQPASKAPNLFAIKQINSRQLNDVKEIRQNLTNNPPIEPERIENLVQKRTKNDYEQTTKELQIDYKDKLFQVELYLSENQIDYLNSGEKIGHLKNKVSNLDHISLFRKDKPVEDMAASDPRQTDNKKILHSNLQLLQSKFKAWIAELMNKLCKSSFFGYFSKQMSEKETKVYFSKNYIYNYIRSRNYLRSCANGLELEKVFLQLFEKQSKSCLKFLKLKYPQQQKAYVDEKIYNLIPTLDLSLDYESYVINQLGFKKKAFDWKQIKLFINSLIKETNSKEKFFKQTFTDLFKEKSGTLLTGLYFAVNTKIKPNTPMYSAEEIEQHGLIIKSPQIMRIIIKWIEYLQELIIDVSNNKKSSEWFNSPDKGYWEVWDDETKRSLSESLKNNGKFNESTKMFEPIKEQENAQKTIIRNFSKRVIDIMNEYKSRFQIVPSEQADIGIFTSVMSSTIQSLASEHLHYLLDKLQLITQKPYQKSIIFPIFDMFRGKCSGTFRQIEKVYENIIENQNLKIIKVKNRLNTSNKDFLINLIMQGTAFVCQLQLHIQDSSSKTEDQKIVYKSSCSNTFNHFLYELQRSKYGPLSESVTLFQSQDEIASFFSLNQLQKFSKEKTRINFNREIIVNKEYQLQILQDTEFKVFTNQSMDIFCNCCLKIYKSYSFFLPFAMKESDGTTICSSCLLLKLDDEDIKKLILKSYHPYFKPVMSEKEFNQLKPEYIVIAGKLDRELIFCKKSNKIYLSTMLEVLEEKNIKRIKISKNLFDSSFVYMLSDPSVLIEKTIGVDDIQELVDLKTIEALYKPKYFGFHILLLPKQQDKSSMVLDVFSDKYSEGENKQLEIARFIAQIESQAKVKSGSWKLEYSKNNNQLFQHIPQNISNTIYNLTISNCLSKTPSLKIKNLRNLGISLQCKWMDIDFKLLEVPKIEVLRITLESSQELIDVRKLPFVYLLQLEIYAEEEVDCFKFQSNDVKIEEGVDQDWHEKRIKHQEKSHIKNNLYKKPSISSFGHSPTRREYNNSEQKDGFKQGGIVMKRQRKTPLNKLQTLHLKFNSFANIVSFNGLNHPNIGYINIEQNHFEQSVINLIDFRSAVLPKLQNLQISTENDQEVKELKGFDDADDKADTPLLEVFSVETHCHSINLQYLNVKNLKEYTHRQWSGSEQSHTIVHPEMDFQKLEQLTVQNSDFPFENIRNPQKLQILELHDIKDCNAVIQKHSGLLPSLRNMTISDTKRQEDLRLVQELNSLQKLSISGFKSIKIDIKLTILRYLQIKNTQLTQLDLSSIESQELETLRVQDNGKLESIKFKSPDQVFYLKTISMKNNNFGDRIFEGVEFYKKNFWGLKELSWNGNSQKKAWWDSWNLMKVPSLKDKQLVFDQ